MNKTIAVTGHTGFLGRAFLLRARDSYHVLGVGRKETGLGHEELTWDLKQDKNQVLDADCVVHFAARTDQSACEDDPLNAYKVNVMGTLRLLEAAKKNCTKFVFVSTGSVYRKSDRAHGEEAPIDSVDVYSLTKKHAEELCTFYTDSFSVIIVRPFFPYGPNSRGDRLVDTLINRIENNEEVLLHNENKPKINPIFIEDFNNALLRLISTDESGVQPYNLAGKDIVNIKELSERIGDVLGKDVHYRSTGKTVSNVIGDTRKLENVYSFEYGIHEGIKKTIESRNSS